MSIPASASKSVPASALESVATANLSHRGIPVKRGVDVQDYLAFEQTSRVKHELKNNDLFMMAGASERHNRISGKLYARLLASEVHPCRTYFADMKLKLEDDTIYYPDIMVVCDETDNHPYYKTRPCLLVEVLSKTTEAIDRGEKALVYRQLPSLEAYVLISQTSPRAEVYRRSAQGWLLEDADEVLELPCLNSAINVADIYA